MPDAVPGLIWNMMMSVSGGWVFVVASAAITVSGRASLLPGIGSYIAAAIAQRDLGAIGYAVLVMLVVILLYDQLLFRPLLAWSRKFRGDPAGDEDDVRPWFLIVMQRARLFDLMQSAVLALNRAIDQALAMLVRGWSEPRQGGWRSPIFARVFDLALLAMAAAAVIWLIAFVRQTVLPGEIGWAIVLGGVTALRVLVLIALASLIWVPIGVWIGLRPRLADPGPPLGPFLSPLPPP